MTAIDRNNPILAYKIKQGKMCSLNWSLSSSSFIHIVGNRNPIAAPRAYAATDAEMAITRSFDANQTLATLAGALLKNGWPIPHKT